MNEIEKKEFDQFAGYFVKIEGEPTSPLVCFKCSKTESTE
jgi:hypothetical protein